MRFDRFELLPARRLLLEQGRPLEIGTRALDLLIVLAESAGQLLTKDTLLDRVWPDVIVEEANLHVQVSALRKLLGRAAIATVPGRGYQFVLPVEPGNAAAGPPAAVPAVATAPVASAAGLPALLGRDAEFAQVCSLLERQPLVTITGAGGSGKTLLARHAMQALHLRWPQRAAWVDLLEVSDADGLPAAVATALGFETGGASPQALARALRGSERLLVLDNAEHLLVAVAALVQTLREAEPRLRLLVTSQAPLRLAGEERVVLRGLPVPQQPCGADEARGFAAVALFAERARQVDRRFRLDGTTVDDTIAICAALAGSALGVQLAASLLGMQPLAEVRRRLVPPPPTAEAPAPAPAENVLRAALLWSHGLLDESPRRVFRRLAVALGPLPLPLLCEVVADDAFDEVAVADALADLVDRSLVSVELSAGSAAPRYRLLELPRALALEQLQHSGEASAWRERLARAVGARARDRHVRWRRHHATPFASDPAIDIDWPTVADLHAALAWNLERDLAAAAAIALDSSTHQIPAARRIAIAARLSSGAAGLPAREAGDALSAAAALTKHSDLGRRTELFLAAADRYEQAGDPIERYIALARAAEAAAMNGKLAASDASLAQARAVENRDWSAQVLEVGAAARAALLSARGEHEAAVPAWREALALGRAVGAGPVSTLISLADAELTVGEFAAAAGHLDEAAHHTLRSGKQIERLGFVLANLTAARLLQGDLPGARAAAAEGWPQARSLDADAWWADHLALLAACEGRARTAALLLGLADAAYARIKDRRHALEERNAGAADSAARAMLGEERCQALRRRGADPALQAWVTQAALAQQDVPDP